MIDFKKYDILNIYDIADVERAVKGKRYKAGSTLIALSATKGDVEYLDNESEVDTRYAVVTPKIECFPYYIYISIQEAFPKYISKYLTGINLQYDNLKYLNITVHDLETQSYIAKYFKMIDMSTTRTEKEIETIKDIKKNMLSSLIV